MTEIERKFLVKSDKFKTESFKKTRITQGFLSTNPKRTVRVRIKGDFGFLTIKGKSNKSGTSRFEWEKEIPISEAQELLNLCKKGIIDKIRYEIKVDDFIYEVDEFLGHNQGLIVAEIELNNEEQKFRRPDWLGNEVTGEIKYYNSQLSMIPYCKW